MGSYRSKEDEVVKISTLVFVANFPDSFGAKDLWNTCKQYGQVIDAYIPYRRSKAGKRFGFVRFIKVLDVDRLVNNLCTVWVGRHKLQANIPRFQREPLKRHSSLHNIDGVKMGNSRDTYNSNGVKDYSLCLMGKVKDFATLANLKVVVNNEGFDNIKFKYMGGYWVMMEFQTEVNSVMKTWFSQIQLASSDFNIDGRVTWVEIEGIPLKMWSKNTFNRVASKWDVLLDVDDQEDEHFHRKRICINTNVPTNIFESFKLIYRGKVFWVRAKEVPGWIPDFVEDNDGEEDLEVGSYEEVPNGEDVKNVEDLEGDSEGEIVSDTKFEEDFPNQKGEEDSVGQGNVQSEDPFNIYELLNHKRPVIDNNSNSKESLKYPPGYTPNRNASAGNSSGILCVWDPNMFKNTNSTVSDYFVMVRGDWMPNVRNKSKRFGTLFNRHGADVFNRFISNAGLEEVSLEGYSFTWCHRSATKMSKQDRFLISDSLLCLCLNISSITLDRYLSDHRPILMRDVYYDYGPVPFRFFHYWFEVDGFDKFIEDSWKDAPIIESNALVIMMKKLKRTEVVNLLQEVEKKNSLETAQKAKLKWAIEGDENSKRCGIDKSPGLDGFTFGFYRRYWKLIENDVVDAVTCFFIMVHFLKAILANRLVVALGGLVNEIQLAFVADKQILDVQFILNELVQWCKKKKKQSLIFKVDFEKAYDSVRWDHLDDIMRNLHISFQRVVDVGLFKGIELAHSLNLSHMFYADDAIFMGQWSESNIDTIVKVLDCFNRASGLRINMTKRSKVGGCMSRIQSCNETIERMTCRLSKWKLKTLSIGGRLTLLKSVLGSKTIYHTYLFKVPKKVLHRMESMRSHFFNGAELSSKKSVWVKWKHALASKDKGGLDKGGLGVSSLFALNRALMFKWVWCFITQGSSLWARVIKTLHSYDGKIGQKVKSCYPSLWLYIIHEVEMFKSHGIDLVSLLHSKLGNGANTSFWEVAWRGGAPFKSPFPRLYELETQKKIDVASDLSHSGLDVSFCRPPRGGVEIQQFEHMKEKVKGCILADMMDRWFWALEGSGEFTITSVRKMIDDFMLPEVSSKTRWIKAVLIKYFAYKRSDWSGTLFGQGLVVIVTADAYYLLRMSTNLLWLAEAACDRSGLSSGPLCLLSVWLSQGPNVIVRSRPKGLLYVLYVINSPQTSIFTACGVVVACEMDLFAFICHADPTKVQIGAATDKLKGKKNKRRDFGASGSDHPPKKLGKDHGTSSDVGASTGGKSLTALQGLLEHSTLAVEVGVTAVATVPFVTASVTPTPKREGGNTDSVFRPNLYTQRPSKRFVISSDSSHHSSTNAADVEVTFLVGSFVSPPPVMTATVTTTNVICASSIPVLGARAELVSQVHPSIFADSASIGAIGPDDACPSNPAGTELSADTFYVPQEIDSETLLWTMISFLPSLMLKRHVKHALALRHVDLLKERDVEIANLKAQLSLKEAEAIEAMHLYNQVSVVEAAKAARVSELNSLKERNSALEEEKNAIEGKVTTLEFAAAAKETELTLPDQVSGYELFKKQCEAIQDEQVKVLSDRVARLDSELMTLDLHLDEKFYPRFLTTIVGRRWIIDHGLSLAIMKCHQSSEYGAAFGAIIGLAIDKCIQAGLVAGIDH
uniref:RNA-directed DNA polymerase, eukaryota, reverse transcriptase zinc-binding domain protein n=1 Tax=Tanacetum cinerariifolium TaxID=118510 RepID=A0A6L2NFL9_TANCI|nr:RNA-directed DNA polymerase, eukaryota, reverse transcriptase zinc-binding domain protein [Tanacetum cinerariifolium]